VLNLSIEDYFAQVRSVISQCPIVESFLLDCDRRDAYEGFWRAEITFNDQSVLKVREFVSVEVGVDRDMDAYQYMSSLNRLIFRYDNTPHHQKLNLPTFPHHKHDGAEENVVSSVAPTLDEVLDEIRSVLNSVFKDK
jgi:Family of unknown function (DUF6516)